LGRRPAPLSELVSGIEQLHWARKVQA